MILADNFPLPPPTSPPTIPLYHFILNLSSLFLPDACLFTYNKENVIYCEPRIQNISVYSGSPVHLVTAVHALSLCRCKEIVWPLLWKLKGDLLNALHYRVICKSVCCMPVKNDWTLHNRSPLQPLIYAFFMTIRE